MSLDRSFTEPAAVRSQRGAIFVALELSRSAWLVTSLSPGSGEKLSKREIGAGDVSGLLARLKELRQKALTRTGVNHPIIVIEEAGLDGFWLHRVLEQEGCESHVVDPASIAAPRRRRRAKTDRLDGEAWFARAARLQTRRTPGLLDGSAADARGRGRAADLSRARRTDRGAGST